MTLLRAYWKSIVVTMVIIYGCLIRQPHYHLPPIDQGDKWAHLLAFGVLGIALIYDLSQALQASWRNIGIAAAAAALLGGAIEILQQQFFYPRTGEWSDWLADCLGIVLGMALTLIGRTLIQRKLD